MANSKHLEILMYGVAAWNDWRKENSDIIPDLSHADLRWAYLSEADFSGANLSNAKLSGANLSNADLCRANLSKCTLRDANLKQTNISDANFGKAEFFSKANLNGANLGGANLSRVDLSGASLKNTCLAGAQIEDTNFNNADWGKGNGEHILKLLKAILKRAEEGIVEWNNWREENPHIKPDLREVFLYEANLSGANFSMTNLSNANLRNADLSMTNLSKANLRRTNLRGANLSKAHLGNVCLLNAQIEGANFNNTIWDGGNGEHILKLIMAISKGEEGIVEWNKWRNKKRNIMPNLRGANLSRAKLNRVNLSGADLRGTNLSGIDLSGAKLKGAISDDSHLIDFLLRIFTFNEGRDELGKFMERIEEERDVSTRNKFIERLSKHLITLSESKLSVSHPKLLSKKFKSRIMMSFFSERLKKNFLERLEEELSQSEYSFKDYKHIFEKTGITPGSKIVIELNHHIHVSEKVTLVVEEGINKVAFLAKPKETCEPDQYKVFLTIHDAETSKQLESCVFKVKVVDFAFGQIPRPLLLKFTSVAMVLASLVMFLLVFLGKIDQTLGVKWGAAIGAMASVIYTRFFFLFRLMYSPKSDSS